MLAEGALLVGAGFGGMMLVADTLGIVLTVVVWTFSEMILLPGASTYMAEIAPAKRRDEYMGVFQMTFSLAFALSGWFGTLILDECGADVLWGGAFGRRYDLFLDAMEIERGAAIILSQGE